ncbi:MAG: GDSL-type esterase/lipase family protein [Propionibacteriaceae bacterium]|nr:GDSL-type esterase/lipase family protein [Propionibacteriaceae bacterium]
MRGTTAVLVALVVALAGLVGVRAVPARAASDRQLSVVVLGDSYSAGNGAGAYYGPKGSFRSRNNWGHRYVDWLNSSGVHATLRVLAHSGATVDQVRQQVAEVPETADLVLLTAGGNDAGFGNILSRCFVVGLRDASRCRDAVEQARSFVRDGRLRERTLKLLQALDERLPGNHAQIVLVGYPQLSLERPGYVLTECVRRHWGRCRERLNYAAATEVRAVGVEAARVQAGIVEEWNARSGQRVHHVASVQTRFAGHEPDPSTGSRNPYRWVNEFLETEGRLGASGLTESRFSWESLEWYHPNLIGHEQLAEAVQQELGVPASARLVTAGHAVTSADGELLPASTMQPFAWIQGPYVVATGEEVALDARASFAPAGALTSYEWDLDGDGVFETPGDGPTLSHTWQAEFSGEVGLRVTDSNGQVAVATTAVDVSRDGDAIPEAQDNCPDVANHGQEDFDGDGIGDVCDEDPGIPTTDRAELTEKENTSPAPMTEPTPEPPSAAPESTSPERPGLPRTGRR